jgi:carboxyl-terminal processing protease
MGGRPVYGGGAITPDVIVAYDTISSAEQKLARTLVPRSQDVYIVLDEYAFSLKDKVAPDFTVTPAMREEFRAQLVGKGVVVDREEWEAGRAYVTRMLGNRIARRAFGDSTAKRREIPGDVQLQTALSYLRRSGTTADLLARAAASATPSASARRPD